MSTPLRQNLTFPVGRLISGSVHEARTKDQKGNLLLTKDGKPRVEFAFGVAYDKVIADPTDATGQRKISTVAFYQADWGAIIYGVGRAGFPQAFNPDGTLKPGYKLSFKVTDGDSTEYNTAVPPRRPCDTPEWKGQWVVWFKSSFPPTTYDTRQWNPKMGGSPPALDAKEIQPGDYVQVAGSVDTNNDAQKPGVYVNHGMVALAGYHPAGRIARGPDPSAANFGASPAPAGMVSTPVGGLPAAGAPPASTPVAPLPPPPAASPALPPPAQTAVQPHPSILTPGAAVAPPPAAVPTPPPSGPQVTAKANGATWEQLATAGWTPDVARAHGMIV